MVRHSPSPESRRPIQKWEVKAIADEVETWYEQGSPPLKEQKSVSPPAQTQQPKRSAPPVIHGGEERQHPIQKEDVTLFVDAAEQLLTGGDEATSKRDLDDKIRALRIEEAILKYVPEFADELRLDAKPHWLAAEQYRLLPNDEVDPVVKTVRGAKIESHPPLLKESC